MTSTIWETMHFDERQRKEIAFSRIYMEQFAHGTDGHNAKQIVARMANLLDTHFSIRENKAPYLVIEGNSQSEPVDSATFVIIASPDDTSVNHAHIWARIISWHEADQSAFNRKISALNGKRIRLTVEIIGDGE